MLTPRDKCLLWAKSLKVRRRLRRLNLDSVVQALGFVFLLVIFWGLCFHFVSKLYGNVYHIDVIGPVILKRIVSIGFFSAFIIVAGSHVLTAYSSLFRSHELVHLMSSPYPVRMAYRFQSLEALIKGGWVLGLFCLPFILAYGSELGVQWWYYPLVLAGLGGFLGIAGLLGILIMLFIARWIAGRPVRSAAAIALFLGGFLGVFALLAIYNQDLTRVVSPSRLGETLANMRFSSIPWLPSQWMSELMAASLSADPSRALIYLGMLVSTAFLLWHAALELGERWYADAFLWTQDRVGLMNRPRQRGPVRFRKLWIMRLLPRRAGGFIYKEIRLFARDFSQWGQLVLIIALILFYTAHTQNAIQGDAFSRTRYLLAFFNVTLLGFVQATLSLRYTYPAVSLEGKAFWVVASAENGVNRCYFAKYYLHSFALLLIGQGMGMTLNHILGVDPTLNKISLFVLFLFSFGFTGWTLGLGAVFRKFEATSPAEVTSDTGTLIAMIVTLMYFGVSIAFLASFALKYTPGASLIELLALNQEQGLMVYITAFLLIQTASILLPTAYGIKSLRESTI